MRISSRTVIAALLLAWWGAFLAQQAGELLRGAKASELWVSRVMDDVPLFAIGAWGMVWSWKTLRGQRAVRGRIALPVILLVIFVSALAFIPIFPEEFRLFLGAGLILFMGLPILGHAYIAWADRGRANAVPASRDDFSSQDAQGS